MTTSPPKLSGHLRAVEASIERAETSVAVARERLIELTTPRALDLASKAAAIARDLTALRDQVKQMRNGGRAALEAP